jgi:hypothetical protein
MIGVTRLFTRNLVTMRPCTKVTALIFAIVASSACRGPQNPGAVSADLFNNDKYQRVLAFDLREDTKPLAALVVQSFDAQTQRRTVVLPFASTEGASSSNVAAAAWGSFSGQTVVDFKPLGAGATPEAAAVMLPVFDTPKQSTTLTGDVTSREYPGNVYYVADGQARLFLFRMSSLASSPSLPDRLGITPDPIDAVGVALPAAVQGRALQGPRADDGITEHPNHDFNNKDARFYAVASSKRPPNISSELPGVISASDGYTWLQVAYELPANAKQLRVARYSVTALTAILPPLLALVFVPSAEIGKPRARKRILAIGGVIQIGILIALLISFWQLGRAASEELTAQTIIAVIGALFTGAVGWIKLGRA